MSRLSFDDDNEAPVKAAAKKTASKKTAAKKTAPAKETPSAIREAAPKRELAKPQQNSSGIHGEIDESDIILPRLNLVNPTSKLCTEDDMPIGSFVLEKEVVLATREGKLNFVVLDLTKLFQQKVDYQGGETPNVVATKAEVLEAGGTLDWSPEAVEDETYYQNLAHVVMLVQAPSDLDESELHRFPLEYDGAHWARVIFTVAGGAYNSFAKAIVTHGMGKLRRAGGLFTGLWTVKAAKKSNDDNTWYVPVSKLVGVVDDPDTFAFLAEQASDDFSTARTSDSDE